VYLQFHQEAQRAQEHVSMELHLPDLKFLSELPSFLNLHATFLMQFSTISYHQINDLINQALWDHWHGLGIADSLEHLSRRSQYDFRSLTKMAFRIFYKLFDYT
jgi:hypothetical protein